MSMENFNNLNLSVFCVYRNIVEMQGGLQENIYTVYSLSTKRNSIIYNIKLNHVYELVWQIINKILLLDFFSILQNCIFWKFLIRKLLKILSLNSLFCSASKHFLRYHFEFAKLSHKTTKVFRVFFTFNYTSHSS